MRATDTRKLGRSGLSVTVLGLGGAPLGDLYERIPETRALATVRRAHELGLRLFDTAPLYGHGLSEHRFGHVLRQIEDPGRLRPVHEGGALPAARGAGHGGARPVPRRPQLPHRSRLQLRRRDACLRAELAAARHGSRGRGPHPRRGRLDLGKRGSGRASLPRGHGRRLPRAARPPRAGRHPRDRGRGQRDQADDDVRRCRRLDTFMLAGRYTLLEQEPLDALLPLCAQKGIGILTAGPFNSGILATGAVEGAKYNYRPAPPDIIERVRRLEAVCGRHGVLLAAAAVQFPLAHPAVCSMVPGAVRPEEVGGQYPPGRDADPRGFLGGAEARRPPPGGRAYAGVGSTSIPDSLCPAAAPAMVRTHLTPGTGARAGRSRP